MHLLISSLHYCEGTMKCYGIGYCSDNRAAQKCSIHGFGMLNADRNDVGKPSELSLIPMNSEDYSEARKILFVVVPRASKLYVAIVIGHTCITATTRTKIINFKLV